MMNIDQIIDIYFFTQCEKYGYEYEPKIYMWDFRYYMARAEERKYAVDENKLKEYFPLDVVTKGLLEIYQDLLNLKFEEIKNPKVWSDDVTMVSKFTLYYT